MKINLNYDHASYNSEREHGGIKGMTPSEKFMKSLKQPILIH